MRARFLVVMAMGLSACGGAAKSRSNAVAPAAVPIAPAPVAQDPTTSPPPTPDQPKPAEPEKVAIAEDPDAGGEIAEDPDAGGEVTEGKMGKKDGAVGGIGMRGSGAGGGGIGTGGGMGTGSGAGLGYGGMRSPQPPQPSLRWGNPTVKGALDPTIIKRVFRRNQNQLRYCWEVQLQKNPKLQGLIVLKLVIDADGKVSSASASGVHKEIEACAATRAKTWMFPKPQQGTVSVTQPVTFVLP